MAHIFDYIKNLDAQLKIPRNSLYFAIVLQFSI